LNFFGVGVPVGHGAIDIYLALKKHIFRDEKSSMNPSVKHAQLKKRYRGDMQQQISHTKD
jgi:hypothetical protein